jgi:hypothetical protein
MNKTVSSSRVLYADSREFQEMEENGYSLCGVAVEPDIMRTFHFNYTYYFRRNRKENANERQD